MAKGKKKTTKIFLCPIEGCKSQLPYQANEKAYCIKHGFEMVIKEVME